LNEERARQGVEHLQAALFEVISAMRAFLDVAEDLVRDPASAAGLAAALFDGPPGTGPPAHAGAAPDAGGATNGPEPRVTRIPVS
jgi:hypothetical protein